MRAPVAGTQARARGRAIRRDALHVQELLLPGFRASIGIEADGPGSGGFAAAVVAERYCPITPIAFNHASASGAHAVAVEAMRRNPNAWPPFAKMWISEGTPALRSAVA